MIKRRQNTKVLPYKPERRRFEQDQSYMSWAIRKMAVVERRRNAQCSDKRECSSEDSSVDRISMLPDELLGLILSRVTLKEQVATSILSRRWRYLWTFTTRLDFDRTDSLAGENNVRWVNHVLQSCKSFVLKDFRVCFYLSKEDQGCIDEWLRYALARKAETLELNLMKHRYPNYYGYGYGYPYPWYRFAYNYYVFRCSFVQENLLHFKQLKRILLHHVDVNGEALEFLLHNCPLLEDLSVSCSRELSTLRVTAPFPSLKRLEISTCNDLRSLHICDVVNLVYFKYHGRRINFLVRNLPMLVNLALTSDLISPTDMKDIVVQFRSILEQIEILNINVGLPTFCFPVKMSNLKQLVVTCKLKHYKSSLPLTNIILSAPRLQKFVLKGDHSCVKFCEKAVLQRTKIKKNLYPQLKEVDFFGFCGVRSDLEFVFHIVDNAHALNKIVIDPTLFKYTKALSIAQLDRAEKQLAKKLPSNIKLDFHSLF